MKYKYIDLRIGGLNDSDLGDFLRLCVQIQYLGIVGASRTIKVHVDGDGSGSLKFVVLDKDPKKNEFLPLPKFTELERDKAWEEREKYLTDMEAYIGE